MQKKIELLAPCGNMQSLYAAAAGGCDAVYLGLSTFSARAFAGNFTHEEYLEAISFCHLRGIRIYVTLNTLYFETEIGNVMKEVQFLYENDVDALIVQDPGLFYRLRTEYPDLEIHCSTQMHIHNEDGALFMIQQGASRIVIARETPLEIIRRITGKGIQVEVFGYGALCISYSGQCLMSSALKNRSGNRGMCAQYCRMKYCTDRDNKYQYLLSPKDLNIIDRLPEIIEAGVCSIKIEGRMKRPEYVYLVVKTFREAIDAYYNGKSYSVDPLRHEQLLSLFNREFTEGHLFHADRRDRMNPYRPNHQGILLGHVQEVRNDQVAVKLTHVLHQRDGLRILDEREDIGLTAVKILKNGKYTDKGEKGDTVWLTYRSDLRPKKNAEVRLTSDEHLLEEIEGYIRQLPANIPVNLTYEAVSGDYLTITVKDEDGHTVTEKSSVPCQKALKAPITSEKLHTILNKTDTYPFHIVSCTGNLEDIFLPVSEINQVRREAYRKLAEQRSRIHTRNGRVTPQIKLQEKPLPEYRIIIEHHGNSTVRYPEQCNITENDQPGTYRKYPVVNEQGITDTALSHALLSETGALNHSLDHCIAGMTLNITNSYALEYMYAMKGIEAVIVSSEVNELQMEKMLETFISRHGFTPPVYVPVYGRRTLMYIKDGIAGNTKELKDLQGNRFPLIHHPGYTEILENKPFVQNSGKAYGKYLILTVELNAESNKIQEGYHEEFYERI